MGKIREWWSRLGRPRGWESLTHAEYETFDPIYRSYSTDELDEMDHQFSIALNEVFARQWEGDQLSDWREILPEALARMEKHTDAGN